VINVDDALCVFLTSLTAVAPGLDGLEAFLAALAIVAGVGISANAGPISVHMSHGVGVAPGTRPLLVGFVALEAELVETLGLTDKLGALRLYCGALQGVASAVRWHMGVGREVEVQP